MPEIIEPLMAPGEVTVPFFRDPEVEAILDLYPHLRFEWLGQDVLMARLYELDPQRALYVVRGSKLLGWLGVEDEGSHDIINFNRYCAGSNKLYNGDFELGELGWRRGAENSKWVVDGTGPLAGMMGARTNVDFQDDDVLQSDETFEVFLGDTMRLSVLAQHVGGGVLGNLRLRQVYQGRFKHPNLNIDPGFDDASKWELGDAPDITIVNDPANAYEGDNVLKVGPISKEQYIVNGGFEQSGGSAEGWDLFNNVAVDDATAHKGSWSLRFGPGGADTPNAHQVIDADDLAPDAGYEAVIWALVDNDPPEPQPLHFRIQFKDDDGEFQILEPINVQPNYTKDVWRRWHNEFSFPDDWDESVDPTVIIGTDEVMDLVNAWWVDDVKLRRIRGNVQAVAMKDREGSWDNVDIIPGKRYRVTAKVKSAAKCTNGEIWMRAAVRRSPLGSELDDDLIESQRIGLTEGKWTKFEWEFTSPSGYDRLNLHVFGQDVYGGAFYVDKVEIRLADDTEFFADVDIAPGSASSATTFTLDAAVPEGAETVHVEVIAEDDGAGWRVDNVFFGVICTPATAQGMVADFLNGTGLTPGDVEDAGPILFDWVARNVTRRQALEELTAGGLVQPAREFRENPDGTLDWGTAELLFVDRTQVVLTERDVIVRTGPDLRRSIERYPTKVKVIGAERTTFRGKRFVVTGEASNPVPAYTKFDGTPYARTRLVEDGTVEHPLHANALAEEIAADAAQEARLYTVELNDWTMLGRFDVGDWVYLHYPSEGAEDVSADPVQWEGETLWPVRLRVLSRTWTLGRNSVRVFARASGGAETEVTDFVDWPVETVAQVTLGDRRVGFVSNPQGGGVAKQYLRYRKSVGEVGG